VDSFGADGNASAADDAAAPVISLCGWLQSSRPVSSSLCFGLLRDHTGVLQISWQRPAGTEGGDATTTVAAIAGAADSSPAQLARLPLESVVRVSGRMRARPAGQANPLQGAAGAVELVLESLHVLNVPAGLLPLSLESDPSTPPAGFPPSPLSAAINDELRMANRFLELRKPWAQRLLQLRSEVAQAARTSLLGEGFTEVETPALFKSTPEGAAEFLVPTRARGKFYALPQSPQQHKQLLMVGGVSRYFQLARCFRDEGGRTDRQPEFTQIDLEMSFVNQEDVMNTVENMFRHITESTILRVPQANVSGAIPSPSPHQPPSYPLPRHSYAWAMSRYGVDKPDTRFALPINDITPIVRAALNGEGGNDVRCAPFETAVAAAEGSVLALRAPALDKMSRKDLESLQRELGPSVLVVRQKDGEFKTPALFAPLFADASFRAKLTDKLALQSWHTLLIAAAPAPLAAHAVLGRARMQVMHALVSRDVLSMSARQMHAFWVVDFPLFDLTVPPAGLTEGLTLNDVALTAMHHPFTAPVAEDAAKLDQLLLELEEARQLHGGEEASIRDVPLSLAQLSTLRSIRGAHYDLVCNGVELGGGSIRLHSARLQRQVLQLLGADLRVFAHLLTALDSGAPPHGGLAIGMDRLVALLAAHEQETWNEKWLAQRRAVAAAAGPSKGPAAAAAASLPTLRSYGLCLPIRDVIAFPKTSSGNDLMALAPSEVSDELLKQYHIQVAPLPEANAQHKQPA
jgi:aspartyl-tRNA synthetase